MRIVFCGSGSFAVPALRALCAGEHELACALTQPPRRAGRGGKLRPTPLSQAAGEMSVGVTDCDDINSDEMIDLIASREPDVILVADFGQMVRKPARDCARIDTINIHGSLLPELRGAAPVNWAIIRGHEVTGVAVFSLVDAMDAGAVITMRQTPIAPDETAGELKLRLAEMGAEAVCEALDLLASGRAAKTEQDHALATRAPIMKKSDGRVDWSRDAVEVRNLIHGTWPWPGGQTIFQRARFGGGKELPVVIARARVEDGPAAGEPGRLDDELCVCTGQGRLRILELRPAGKRLMAFEDFIHGYRVEAGDGFITTSTESG